MTERTCGKSLRNRTSHKNGVCLFSLLFAFSADAALAFLSTSASRVAASRFFSCRSYQDVALDSIA